MVDTYTGSARNRTFNIYAHDIHIFDAPEEPLFCATEIGELLEIENMHSTLSSFDEDEKVLHMDTPLGKQEVDMLTVRGVYRLSMMSQKPFAKRFMNWVFNVTYDLKKTINKELVNKRQELEVENMMLGMAEMMQLVAAMQNKYEYMLKNQEEMLKNQEEMKKTMHKNHEIIMSMLRSPSARARAHTDSIQDSPSAT